MKQDQSSEKRPGEATGQSAAHLQQKKDPSSLEMPVPWGNSHTAAAAVAVEWSQSEPSRQGVCAAEKGTGEVTQDL